MFVSTTVSFSGVRKVMMISRQQKVAWDSQTNISEPDRMTNEPGVDDSDDDAHQEQL